MLNLAMYGTKDTAQCFDSHCERTMEKIGLQHWSVQRTQIAEFKEDLSKHLLAKHIATLGRRPQLLDVSEIRFLNRVIRWVVPQFGKAPERIEIEADPRHSELLIKNSGLQTNSTGVNTLGERHAQSNFHYKIPHHTVPMACDSRIYQLIELNCSLPIKN